MLKCLRNLLEESNVSKRAGDADSENRKIFSITLLAVGEDIENQHIMV